MRVVLDPNVLVSGIFFGGVPGRILEAWRDGRVELVISREILQEYVRVGERLAERFSGVDLPPTFELLAISATLVDAPTLAAPIPSDPDDDKFLACAQAAGASYVISGDRDLLDVSPFRAIEVLRPRTFLEGPLARLG